MTTNQQPHEDPSAVLQTVNDNMMEGLGQLASYFGYNKLIGQLYGALFLSSEPLSLDDLTDLLSKSKASVSMNMRSLEQMGVVREVWVRDSRKKFYEAESDLWKALTNVVRQREMRDLQRALEVLGGSIEQIKAVRPQMDDDQKVTADHYTKRIDQLQDFFRLAVAVLNSLMQYGLEFDVNQLNGDSKS